MQAYSGMWRSIHMAMNTETVLCVSPITSDRERDEIFELNRLEAKCVIQKKKNPTVAANPSNTKSHNSDPSYVYLSHIPFIFYNTLKPIHEIKFFSRQNQTNWTPTAWTYHRRFPTVQYNAVDAASSTVAYRTRDIQIVSTITKNIYYTDARVFQKFWSHLKILGATWAPLSKFRSEGPNILGATVQNLVSRSVLDLCIPSFDIPISKTV